MDHARSFYERTHHALGGLLVPADRYFGRADEVLARIEAGALREGDELGLGDRGAPTEPAPDPVTPLESGSRPSLLPAPAYLPRRSEAEPR